MEEYCNSRNRQMQERERGVLTRAGLIFLIAGMILTALSACLITYVLKMTIAMTGISFLLTGIGGALAGLLLVAISLKKVI